MKTITVDDVLELRDKFDKYCERAEQHQIPILAILQMKFNTTVEHIQMVGEILNQEDARAMFRAVLQFMGEDAKDYEEPQYGNSDIENYN